MYSNLTISTARIGYELSLQRLLLITAFALLAPSTLFSQTAQLSGSVLDSQGRAIPGAAIVAHSDKTGTTRKSETNESGYFSLPFLDPGDYSVSVNAAGFKPTVFEHVFLETAQKGSLNCTLEIGSIQETVSVTSDVSLVNTTDGAVSLVVDRNFVENLPLNGRSFESLISLTPGVITNSPQAAATVGKSGEFSVNGQRTETNRYSVDGVSGNNGTFNFGYGTAGTTGSLPVMSALGTTHSLLSVDALQEFRVATSSYSAEYGRQPGGQLIFLTRSGTNALHGSGYDFLRNDALDANNWFNNASSLPRLEERQNDFGVTIGGPLVLGKLYNGRNRTFFFVSYEGLRLKQPLAATQVYVPSEALRLQAPDILKPVLAAFPYVPTAAGRDLGNGLATFLLTDSLPSGLDATSVRMDHVVSPWLRLFFRFADSPSDTATRSRSYLVSNSFHTRSYTFGATSPVASNVVNEFRVGLNTNTGSFRDSLDNIGGAKPVDLIALNGIDENTNPSAQASFQINVPGYITAIAQAADAQQQRQWNVVNTLSIAFKQHSIRIGFDYLRTTSQFQQTSPNVTVQFDTAAHVIANNAYQAAAAVYAKLYPEYSNISSFVQDEWHVSSRLNLSLGIRWEINPAPTPTEGTFPATISGNLTDPASFRLAASGAPLWNTTFHNFAPRAGAAYLLRKNAGYETVVRSGVGVFFDTGQQGSAFGLSNGPGSMKQNLYGTVFGSQASFPLTPAQLAVPLSASLQPPYPTTYTYPLNLQLPYTIQWSVAVEQALGPSQTVTASYVGAGGRKLLQQQQISAASTNPLFGTVVVVSNGLSSSYNALQGEYRRKVTRGLQALLSYTWSHAIDSGSQNGGSPNFGLQYRRGNADFDLRQNLAVATSYQFAARTGGRWNRLLSDWGLDARLSARSGFPLTLQGNLLTDPGTGQQFYGGLNLVPGMPVYIYSQSLPGGRQINPQAFSLPVGAQQGTAPRNFVRGFGATQFDLALRREFPLLEGLKLQIRAEAFNVLNHPEFGLINTTFGNVQFGQATRTLNSSLGGVTALYQQGGPRSMQLAVKFVF